MQPLWEWFEWLRDAHGVNLTIAYDDLDRSRFVLGVRATLALSAACIAASLVAGLTGAWMQMSRRMWSRALVSGYVQFFRNTPPLVQLYFFYFAMDAALSPALGTEHVLGGFGWAVVSMGLFAGAFNVEIFRAGIEAIPRPTIEAAKALGYTRFGVYRRVMLPLAFRVCLPALNNNLINLVKTTTLAYAIAVPETLYVANQIWSDEYNVPEMMNVVWLVYILIVGALAWGMNRWERAVKLPGFGAQ